MTANGKVTAAQAAYALSRGDENVRVLLKVTERGLMPAMLKGDAIVGTLVEVERNDRHYTLTFRIGIDGIGCATHWRPVRCFGHQSFWRVDELTQNARFQALKLTEAWLRLEEAEAEKLDRLHEASTDLSLTPLPDVERGHAAEQTVPALDSEDLGMCLWFAMCELPATHLEPHPIFGEVPACDRCVKIGR